MVTSSRLDSVFTPIIANFADKGNTKPPRTILPAEDIHDQHDYWENWLSRSIDELAAKETKNYLKKIAPMLDKSSPEEIAAVPWRVGNGVQELIQAGWREMWTVGSADAVRELNTLSRGVSKQQKAEFADNNSTLEENNPVAAQLIKTRGNPFTVVYPPSYGMPLTRSVLRDAVATRGQYVARGYEGGVQSQIITSIAKSIERHRSNTGMPELAKKRLFDEISEAVDPYGYQSYKKGEATKGFVTTKEQTQRYLKASSAARRVASTELSAAYSLGRLNTYVQAGVQKVRWVNLDRSACAICGDRNGMVYDIGELLAQGDNRFDATQHVIPAHPHCRCHYEPVNEEDKEDREDAKDPKKNPALTGVAAIAGAWTMKQGLKAVASAGLRAVGTMARAERDKRLAERAQRANLVRALAMGAGGALALGALYMLLNEFKREVDNPGESQSIPGISGIVSNTTQQLESEALRSATAYLKEKTTETNAAINATKIPAMATDVLSLSENLRNQPSFARLIQSNPNLNALTPAQLSKVYGLTEWQIQQLKKETEAFQKRMAAPLWMAASPQKILPDSIRRIYPWLSEYPDLRLFSLEEATKRTGSKVKGQAVIDYITKQLRVMQALPMPGTYQLNGTGADRLQREDWLALLPPGSTSKEQITQSIMQLMAQSRPSTREEFISLLKSAGLSTKAANRIARGGELSQVNLNAELAEHQGTIDKAAQKIIDRSGVSRKIARGIVLEFKDGGSWQGMEDLRRRLEAKGIRINNSAFDALVRAFVANITPLAGGESGATVPVTPDLIGTLLGKIVDAPDALSLIPSVPESPTLQQVITNQNKGQRRNLAQDYITSQLTGQTSDLLKSAEARRTEPSNIVAGIGELIGDAVRQNLGGESVLDQVGRSTARDLQRKQIRSVMSTRLQESLAAQDKVLSQAGELKEELQSQIFGKQIAIPGSRLNTRPAQIKAKAAINVAREQAKIAERLGRVADSTADTVSDLVARVEKVKADYAKAIGGQGEGLIPVDVLSSAYQQDLLRLNKEIVAADKAIKDSFVPDGRGGRIPSSAAEIRLAEMTNKRDQLIALRDATVDNYTSLITSPEVQGRISQLKSRLSEAGSDIDLANLGFTPDELKKMTPSELQGFRNSVEEIQSQIRESSAKDFGLASVDDIPLVREINSQLAATEQAISRLSGLNQPGAVARLANERDRLKGLLADMKQLPKSKKELSPLQAKRHKQTFGDDKERNAALKKIGTPLDSLRKLDESEKVRVNPNAETILDKFRPRTDGSTIFQEELSGIERTAAMGLTARQEAINKNLALLNLVQGPEGADYVFRNTQRIIDMIDDPEIVAGLGATANQVTGLESAAAFRRQIFGLIRERLEKETVVNGVVRRTGAIPDMEQMLDFDTKTRNLAPLLDQANTALAQEIRNQQTGLGLFDDYEKAIEKGLEGVKKPDGTVQSVGLRDAHLEYYLETAPQVRQEIKKRRNEYLVKSSQTITQLQEAKSIIEAEIAKPVSFGATPKTTVEIKEQLIQSKAAVKASSLVSKDRDTVIGLAHKGLVTSVNQKEALKVINKYTAGRLLTDAERQFMEKFSQAEIDAVTAAQQSGGLELLFARNKVIPEINRLEGVRGQLWQKVSDKVAKIRTDTGFQIDISIEADAGAGLAFPARITMSDPRYVDNPDRFRGGLETAQAKLAKPMAELRGLLGIDISDGAANLSERNYSGVRALLQQRRSELQSIELRMETIGFSRSERLSKFLVRQTLSTFTKNDSRTIPSRRSQYHRYGFTASGRRLLSTIEQRNFYR